MININIKQQLLLPSCLFFLALVIFTLGFSLWQWREDWLLAHQVIKAAPLKLAADDNDKLIAHLPDAHLFGQSLLKVGEVPITNLQLRVTGLVKSEDALSKAYISIAGEPGKIYFIGDELPYGVKVYGITNDTVILENNGRLEKLPLPREPLAFKSRETKEVA